MDGISGKRVVQLYCHVIFTLRCGDHYIYMSISMAQGPKYKNGTVPNIVLHFNHMTTALEVLKISGWTSFLSIEATGETTPSTFNLNVTKRYMK